MYIHYSIGNNSGLWTLVHIVEVSVIGGVRFRRFHCICIHICMYIHTFMCIIYFLIFTYKI